MNDNDARMLHARLERMARLASSPATPFMRQASAQRRGILLGHSNGAAAHLPFDRLHAHGLIIGKSGRGKSVHLYNLAAQALVAGYTLVVLDGKGDLCDDLLRLCFRLRKPVSKVAVIDPQQSVYAPGINVLELLGSASPEHTAKSFVEGTKKLYNERETRFWLEEWAPPALAILSAIGHTAAEWVAFAQVGDQAAYREAALRAAQGKLSTSFCLRKWGQELPMHPLADQAAITNILRTRGSLIHTAPALLPILGQAHTTIAWEQGLNAPGNVVLANLGLGSHLSEAESRMLGISILRQVLTVAWERRRMPAAQRNRVFVIIDEAQRYCDRELAVAFDVMRGLGVSFIVACQTLEQLRDEDPYVAASILGNANVLMSFAVARADAEVLAKEMYSGHLDLKQIKHQLFQTKFRPVETTRTIYSTSDSESSSWSEGSSDGTGSMGGASFSQSFIPDEFGIINTQVGEVHGLSEGASNFSGSSHSSGGGSTRSFGETEVPFYQFAEFSEESSRTYYSVEEHWETAIGSIQRQAVQHLTVSVGDQPPRTVMAPTIDPPPVPDALLDRYREACLERFGRRVSEVLVEIEERVPKFIAEHATGAPSSRFSEDGFVGDGPLSDGPGLPRRGRR